MVQTEPWLDRDRAMIDQLKSVGIEKGKPFRPDMKTTNILKSAATEARAWLDDRYEHLSPWYPNERWFFAIEPSVVRGWATGFSDPNTYPVDALGVQFYWGFSSGKRVGGDLYQIYLWATRSKTGEPLDGGKAYRLVVPPKVPANLYWSVTAYDRETHGLIHDMQYASRSSLMPELKANADGTTELWFGPKPPAGKEANWLPTKSGEQFEVIFRVYGAEKPMADKTWILPDIETVN